MYHQGFVVSIVDGRTKRPYREFDHSRDGGNSRVRLTLPFDSEYAFLFKATDGKRRRLDITIDGTPIGVGSVVADGWGTAYLERFLDSDKRFKFVPVTSEGVADPSSSENGVIVVKAWTEITPPPMPFLGNMLRSAGLTPRSDPSGSCLMGSANANVYGTNYSAAIAPCSAGATVEGEASGQVLNTTQWRGDESTTPQEYRFQLVGAVTAPGFCTDCGGKLRKTDRFCAACGVKVGV